MERHLGPLAEPYRHGVAKRLELTTGAGLTGTGLLATRARRSRAVAAAGGTLLAAAALSARINVFRAGRASAVDPKFTVAPQRARADASEHRQPASRARLPASAAPYTHAASAGREGRAA